MAQPIRLKGEQLEERNALIREWYKAGKSGTEIAARVKEKYGVGIHSYTLAAIRDELGIEPQDRWGRKKAKAKPKRKAKTKPIEETALVLASPSGLVPAREISTRLEAMIIKLADVMIEEGVLAINIDGRQITVTYVPEESCFEV